MNTLDEFLPYHIILILKTYHIYRAYKKRRRRKRSLVGRKLRSFIQYLKRYVCIDAVRLSRIVFWKQKLGVTFNFDKASFDSYLLLYYWFYFPFYLGTFEGFGEYSLAEQEIMQRYLLAQEGETYSQTEYSLRKQKHIQRLILLKTGDT